MKTELETQSERLLQIAKEFEDAAAHAKIAAEHFSNGEVPRACAHTLATEGHMSNAHELLKAVAKVQSEKSKLENGIR